MNIVLRYSKSVYINGYLYIKVDITFSTFSSNYIFLILSFIFIF